MTNASSPEDSTKLAYWPLIETSALSTMRGLHREAIDTTGAAFTALFTRFSWGPPFLAPFCEAHPISCKPPTFPSQSSAQELHLIVAEALKLTSEGDLDSASRLLRPWNESNSIVEGLKQANATQLAKRGLNDFALVQLASELFYFPQNQSAQALWTELSKLVRAEKTPLHEIFQQPVTEALALVRARALLYDLYFEYAAIILRLILEFRPDSQQAKRFYESLMEWHPYRCISVHDYALQQPEECLCLDKVVRSLDDRSHAYSIHLLKEAEIVGQRPLLVTKDQRVLIESAPGGDHLRSFPSLITSNSASLETLEVEECLPLVSANSHAFWHWMMEQLPKVILAERVHFGGTYIVPAGLTFIGESLQLLGVPPERLLFFDGTKRILAKRLILTDTPSTSDFKVLPDVYLALRDRLLKTIPRNEKKLRLFVRRSLTRSIVNREALLAIIEPLGFQDYDFNGLPLSKQIELMSSCEILLGAHGAAFAHSLFVPTGAHVVELFSPNYINFGMIPMHQLLKHNYHMVASSNQERYYKHGDNTYAPLDTISLVLENILDSLTLQNRRQ